MVKSLLDLQTRFDTEEKCREYLVQARWNGQPACPYCGYKVSYKIESGKRFKCGNNQCYKKYSVTVGTIFEASNLPLTKWFMALYLITSHKKGISSIQLSKHLGITQKSAWFCLHRIREALKEKGSILLKDEVQVDETFVGGKAEKMNKKTRARNKDFTKAPVIGLMEKGGNVVAVAVPHKWDAVDLVHKHVDKGAILVSDTENIYNHLNNHYTRVTLNHSQLEYARNGFHTNSIECFWSHFKRTITGTYHALSPKHLQRYCDEQTYRYNSRNIADGFRFNLAMLQLDGRLKYHNLVHGQSKKTERKGGYPTLG